MSGLYENLPWPLGSTFGPGSASGGAAHYEGKEYTFEDPQYGTGMFVTVVVCRNSSGIALQGKRAVKLAQTAGKGAYDVAGYCTVLAERSGIVDDQVPATGVPNGDLFYLVTRGPVMARTGLAADATNVIAVGDLLHALTAATTGATTAGRVGQADFTGATAPLAAKVLSVVGRAMSAATTANTNANLLIAAGHF